MKSMLNRPSAFVLSLASLTGAAHAQVIAYEGFNYPSPASLLGQNGGTGFTTPWQSAGYGSWAIDPIDSLYIKSGRQLQSSGNRCSSALGGYQRTLSLGSPLGNSPGSVWISFVARQTAGPTNQAWLGVTLPCSGSANPSLFIGKPFAQPNWGTDGGLGGSIRQTTSSCLNQALIVARIDFRAGADDVHVWVNPDLSGTPSDASADLSLLSYGDFAGITKVLIETGDSNPAAHSGIVDEIRLGATYADVTPITPGVIFGGLQHLPMGAATIAPSSDRTKLIVSNIGSSGQDGVEIKWRSVQGAGVVFGDSGVPNPPGAACRTKYKGWDGTIKGRCDTVTTSDGRMLHTLDYTSMGATSVNVVKYNENEQEVSNVTFAGGIVDVVAPLPCPAGSQFSYKTWYDIWIDGTHFFGYYCNDPIHPIGIIKITPIFPPGFNPDMTMQSVEVTARNMPQLVLSPPEVGVRESPTRCCRNGNPYRSTATATGLGDVLLTEECDTGGSSCTGQDERKLVVSNIGSSGQDGVEVKWRTSQTSTSGNFDLGDILHSDGDATMVLRYLFGLSGTAVTNGSLHVQGRGDHAEVTPDFSGVGSTEFTVIAYLNGNVVRQDTYPNGTPIDVGTDQVVCPGGQIIWGWVTMWVWNPWPVTGSYQTYWGVVGCLTLGGGNGNPIDYTDRIVFVPVNPVVSGATDHASVTARGHRDWIHVMSASSDPASPCPADYNQDGFLDFFDYDDFVEAYETGVGPADFNGDGFVDFFDYDDFVLAYETGC